MTTNIDVGVVGSRDFKDKNLINKVLDKIHRDRTINKIVSGGAIGADTYAEEWAKNNHVEKLIYLPNYKKYGRGAPLIRNTDIINNSDLVVAFWDGESRGTKDSITKAENMNKELIIITNF